eukprot:TRINITY_DN10594_c0_g3_i1.p1 TRINITY_DN10594_c0_g3~~TRINITY_DN10594_c0_g3_i1.p1  ORF type:complete len:753 (-),score=57.93 TRINITY_DN10594_c0_g3_i1:117-2375(-)
MCNLLGLLYLFALRLVRSTRGSLKSANGVLTSRDVLPALSRSSSAQNATSSSSSSPRHVEKKPYDRDCAIEVCAGGQAWSFRIYYAFTSNVFKVRPYVISGFQEAIGKVTEHVPCVEFLALDGSSGDRRSFEESDFQRHSSLTPLEGVILVDSKAPMDCYTQGLGFPGVYRVRYMSLGLCGYSSGTVAHELLHALGVDHEMNRLDGSEQFDGHGPHIELGDLSIEDRRQYEREKSTYMGSRAVGGYAPFDFDSIMMYRAGKDFHTLPDGEYDSRTGQREQLSEGDIEQLKDMYGCLEPTGAVCSTTAASREVDQNGDCSCPAGSECYDDGQAGCPSFQFPKGSEYFYANCATCRCEAMQCPSSSSRRRPTSLGDCACPEDLWCMQDGGAGCASSRSSKDMEYFHSTCKTCKCIPRTCDARSRTDWLLPNDEGDCECRPGSVCRDISAGTLGCPTTNGGIGLKFFRSSCTRCMCVLSETVQNLRCPRYAVSDYPDSEGDCMCPNGKECMNGDYGEKCPYSGGLSRLYSSAACSHCQCVEQYGQRAEPYRSIYMKHVDCNTKCGAQRAMLGPYVWSLHGSGLEDSSCGQCKVIDISGKPSTMCQEYGFGADFQLFGAHTRHGLCCRTLPCTLEEEPCDKRGYQCEENAECLPEDATNKLSNMICKCNDGYEATPLRPRSDGKKCSPLKPAGARCCHLHNEYFMWVPKKFLDIGALKYVCPTVRGQKWHHADENLCENNRFVYEKHDTPASLSER